ncbi:TD and POZ domain-containing protein 4 [Orchesella cincta]|uniref:TD and POZ domain-containing protein 4 n=1 Tax=Orchesella cincta TaxID=48709 RepID=A0A1D2M766_ORCCI|nr:TD and POZ domain-containing protein 4 [Orchesella cincta]
MGGKRKQAYLLKGGEARLQFVGSPPSKSTVPSAIFTPTLENFKCFPNEKYDDEQISAISQALKEANEEVQIEMVGKYDTFYDNPRIYTKVTLPQELVTKLSNVLVDPTISIRGTCKILKREDVREHQPAVRTSIYPYVVYPARIIWKVTDDAEVEFSVEGISLKTQATYEDFKGIEKLAESYKSSGTTHVQLNYSVTLEWVDFTMDFPELERNTFEKLYKNQPFSDCIIVASNKKEFGCHQSILAVHSDVLFTAFGNGMKEFQTNRIEMEDVGGEAVELLLKFMYARKDFLKDLEEKSGQVVLELLQTSHKMNISELELFLCQFLCRKPSNWFSIDVALSFYLFTMNVDSMENLTEKMWSFMRDNPDQISDSTTYQEWLEKEPKVAAQFVLKLLESMHEQKTAVQVDIRLVEEIVIGSDSNSDNSFDNDDDDDNDSLMTD